MLMKPLREVITTPLDRSFLVFSHNYPYPYTGWHYHPEYELHRIQKSSGAFYIGTYAGHFDPGNLVMLGPNLPHTWVTDTNDASTGESLIITERDLVLQFSADFAEKCTASFADCAQFDTLLERSRAGIQFSDEVSWHVGRLMVDLLDAKGVDKLSMFFRIVAVLASDDAATILSMPLPVGQGTKAGRLNSILEYIAENYNRVDLSCAGIAEREGMTQAAFSAYFERNVKCSCIEYINRLRIYRACQMLIENNEPISNICYDIGYEVLSTFNRNFQRYIGITPSEFRNSRGLSWRLKPGQQIVHSLDPE